MDYLLRIIRNTYIVALEIYYFLVSCLIRNQVDICIISVHANLTNLAEAQIHSMHLANVFGYADVYIIDNSLDRKIDVKSKYVKIWRHPNPVKGNNGHGKALDWAIRKLVHKYEYILILDSDAFLLHQNWFFIRNMLFQDYLVISHSGKPDAFKTGAVGHISFLAFRSSCWNLGDSMCPSGGFDTGYRWQEDIKSRFGDDKIATLRTTFRFPEWSEVNLALNSQAFIDIWIGDTCIAHHLGYVTRIFGSEDYKYMESEEIIANGLANTLLGVDRHRFLRWFIKDGVYEI